MPTRIASRLSLVPPGVPSPTPCAPGGFPGRERFRLRPFEPARWAAGPHLQTLAGKLLRPAEAPALARERWETPDGDFLDVDFAPEPACPDGGPARPGARAGSAAEGISGAPVVLVLHGLEGGARRRYALLAYRELAARGIRAVGLNFRSCSGEPNRLARAYHSGETGDLAFVLARLADRFPDRRLGAIGFSLGGNVLLKHLGERGSAAALSAAVAISVPYDLAAGARALESSPMGRFYGWWFLRSLRRKTRLKGRLLEELVSVEAAIRARTIREFDDRVTAPVHGFESAAEYYAASSSAHHLGAVRVPTLLLHALDDPFLPAEALPLDAIRSNPWLVAGLVERGGHVGFMEGSPKRPRFWAESEAARFLAALLTRDPGVSQKKA